MAKAKSKAAAETPQNIFAYIEQSHGDHVPGYASLNQCADGSFWLTVRTSGGKETAGVCLPKDQLEKLAASIAAEPV